MNVPHYMLRKPFAIKKKNLQLAFLLFALFTIPFSGISQNRIYQKIEQAKNSRLAFPEKQPFKLANQKYSKSSLFFNPAEVMLLNYNLNLSELNEQQAMSIKVPLGKKTVILDLIEVNNRFYNYEITLNRGEDYTGKRAASKHYRGVIRGRENSLVALSFFEDDVAGYISSTDGNYNIAKLKNSNVFILYNDTNLKGYPNLIVICLMITLLLMIKVF